ncbi:MAG TPA: response regulator transcription factor [Chitinophagaceae bacterium]|jgi:DNA-binding response OmpR family regulator|nr:response regulator transcription factor [Chitinophagaceae bacterium]
MKNILLVEDDVEIRNLLGLHLQSEAYQLKACGNGVDALRELSSHAFDLVILDINLPDINGLELCKNVRKLDATTPIMMITCLSEESDKVLALELGADDYVTKPFGILELKARAKALLRRGEQNKTQQGNPAKHLICKDLIIDSDKRKACIRGSRLDLTPKEFDLLVLLASHAGKSFSRFELLERVWGVAFEGYKHTITAHINRLRIKIEKDLHHPEYILTTWGTGYRFAE